MAFHWKMIKCSYTLRKKVLSLSLFLFLSAAIKYQYLLDQMHNFMPTFSLRAGIWSALLRPEKMISLYPPTISDPYSLCILLIPWTLSNRRKEFVIDTPFVIHNHNIFLFSALWPLESLCINHHLL